MTQPTSSAAGVAWDLNDLYSGPDDPCLSRDLDAAEEQARAFEATYRGSVNTPEGPSAAHFLQALRTLEALNELMARPAVYAGLLHAGKTDDPRHGALRARVLERNTAANKHLIFFGLEWIQLADGPAQRLMADAALAPYRHYLERERILKPHVLSEAEEKVVDEMSVTGRSAWKRLFDETVASLRCPVTIEGQVQQLPLEPTLKRLYDAQRDVRKAAAEGLTQGVREKGHLFTFILNNLVLDHRIDCDLRHYESPMAPRHLANEITQPVVDALMTACERHHGLVQRYYRLKKRLLGLDTLYDYDRYAVLFPDLPSCDWATARRLVTESYEAFSPEAGRIVREFFERRWVDAELRSGKRPGAFSHGAVPSVHPYILMNFGDKLRDVMTLAHELGHGIHQYLSRPVGYLQAHTPLTTAETASVFGEMLTFQRLLEVYREPRTRLAMLCSKIEDSFATVFRQVVLTRFEQMVHQARREKGELTTEAINALWMDANRPMHGDVVELSEGYSSWWMYIGHFIHVPFYCYAYSFGELLVLALVQKYRQEGAAFVPRYMGLLASGGSDAPDRLLSKLGVDVNDPGFWELGLRLLGDMVTEAEQL